MRSYCYWFISSRIHNKPTLSENGLSRDSFSAFLPHITRNHFSKGKNTGSTDVSKTFIQRGYKSIIKSISKYIITWVRRPLRRSALVVLNSWTHIIYAFKSKTCLRFPSSFFTLWFQPTPSEYIWDSQRNFLSISLKVIVQVLLFWGFWVYIQFQTQSSDNSRNLQTFLRKKTRYT